MAKRVPALVDGSVLSWARESAGYSAEEIALRLGKELDLILAWEANEEKPYMGQLRNLANLYKRPISDFYLPAPPVERAIPHDFRRSPGEVAGRYSPTLRKQLRFARERQDLSQSLQEGIGQALLAFDFQVSQRQPPEDVGSYIRKILGVTIGEQRRWREPRTAWNSWRTKIESLGVLVFQFEGVEAGEAWGFSLTQRVFPVIGINKSLAPNGRTFTMLHEFVHLLLGKSGICDIDDYTPRNPGDLAVEVFCNHAAAAALMPQDAFLADPVVASRRRTSTDWTDAEIGEIAISFSVSREAVVRRLLTFELTTAEFYRAKRASYQAQWHAQKEREREKNKDTPFAGQNRAQRAVSDFGNTYVRLVLSSYGDDRITLADAAEYLEVGPPAVRRVQRLAMG